MAALDREDRNWLDAKFVEVFSHITSLRVDLGVTRSELMGHITSDSCRKIRAHEDRRHDAKKTWAYIGLIISVLVGMAELVKYFALRA